MATDLNEKLPNTRVLGFSIRFQAYVCFLQDCCGVAVDGGVAVEGTALFLRRQLPSYSPQFRRHRQLSCAERTCDHDFLLLHALVEVPLHGEV